MSELCFHPMKPQYGCVAPHTDTTGSPTSEAKCMLAESIDTMTSHSLINANS